MSDAPPFPLQRLAHECCEAAAIVLECIADRDAVTSDHVLNALARTSRRFAYVARAHEQRVRRAATRFQFIVHIDNGTYINPMRFAASFTRSALHVSSIAQCVVYGRAQPYPRHVEWLVPRADLRRSLPFAMQPFDVQFDNGVTRRLERDACVELLDAAPASRLCCPFSHRLSVSVSADKRFAIEHHRARTPPCLYNRQCVNHLQGASTFAYFDLLEKTQGLVNTHAALCVALAQLLMQRLLPPRHWPRVEDRGALCIGAELDSATEAITVCD